MNPIKIAGGVIVLVGFAFRAICLADFARKAKILPDTPAARRRHENQKRNALVIDALVVIGGFYIILRG